VVSEETLRDTLAAEASTEIAVEKLVELALKGGGPDNITAIVADVVEVETKPPSAVPVTVGAAAEGAVKHDRIDTPAAKAAALRPAPEDEDVEYEDDGATHRHRRGRLLLLLVLLLAVVGAGTYGAYRWSQTQYYVGVDGKNVAIYRGLTQDVGPVRTSKLYRHVDVALVDLPAYQQERVRADIATDGLADATHIVGTLRDQAELCRSLRTAAPTPSPSVPAPSGTATPAPPTTTTPTPTPTPTPTGTGGVDASDCGTGP
jgi:protein phosphatase